MLKSRTLRILILVLFAASPASAESLRFGVTAGQTGPRASLSVSELELMGMRLSFRFAGEARGAFNLGLAARRTLPIVPIGNVVFEGAAYGNTVGQFDLFAQGQGTIATVAARLRLEAFNVRAGRFDLSQLAQAETRPLYTTESFGLRLAGGFTYRLDRFVVLAVEPELSWLAEEGFGGGLQAALQLRRLVELDDGHVLLFAELEPGGAAGFVAGGFEYRVNRPEWPALRAAGLLGAGSEGVWPGLRLSLGGVAEGWRYHFGLALEPYRRPGPRYLGSAGLEGPLGPGAFDLLLAVTPGIELSGLSTGYSVGF